MNSTSAQGSSEIYQTEVSLASVRFPAIHHPLDVDPNSCVGFRALLGNVFRADEKHLKIVGVCERCYACSRVNFFGVNLFLSEKVSN